MGLPKSYFDIDSKQKSKNSKIELCTACYEIDEDLLLEEYIIPASNESDDGIKTRKKLTRIGSQYQRGITSMSDVAFRKAPIIETDNEEEQALLDNFTSSESVQSFAKNLYIKGLLENGGLLLNYKSNTEYDGEKLTVAQEKALGITFYTEFISNTRRIDSFTIRDNSGALKRVAIRGTYSLPKNDTENPFGIGTGEEVRVYIMTDKSCQIRIFQLSEDKEWIEKDDVNLDYNPIVEYRYNTLSDNLPLYNEAKLQALEFNMFGKSEIFLDKLTYPTVMFHGGGDYARKKKDEQCGEDATKCNVELALGGSKVFTMPDLENGQRIKLIELVEIEGKNFDNLKYSLERKDTEIKEGFARFVQSQRANKSAEESRNETIEASSRLGANINDIEEVITKCHAIKCQALGIENTAKFSFNKEFLDEQFNELLYMILKDFNILGTLTDEEVIKELEAHNVFKTITVDSISERKKIDSVA